MKIVALIPVKLNSQRLKNKNILPLGSYPLCWHICNTISSIDEIDETYVYCSDPAIKQYVPQCVNILERPKRLDGDRIKGREIYSEFIHEVNADIYVLAHTTSPFIKGTSISKALSKVITGENDSAFAAKKIQTFAWYQSMPLNYKLDDVPRTQDIEPVWVETSAFYIFRKEIFVNYGRRIGEKPYIQEVMGAEAIDIDEEEDYVLACRVADELEQRG